MELQMMMDSGSETLNGGSMWLGHSPGSSPQPQAQPLQQPPPPPYHRLSPNRQDGRAVVSNQQVSMGFHDSASHGVLWQEKRDVSKGSVEEVAVLRSGVVTGTSSRDASSKHPTSFHQSSINGLKRRSGDAQSQITELERKHTRRDGSIGTNGCGHAGWSTQVEELAEHLAADFDGPLSALAASDLANAVASYNMSEALLALPSLTVFKQEAPSPENQASNAKSLNASQRTNEADSNNNNTAQNGPISNVNDGNASTTTTNANSPTRTSIVNGGNGVNQHAQSNNNQGMRNNGQSAPSLHQLLYSSGEDYQQNSSGNHVSSSQQGNEFNEDSRFQYVLAAATSIATKLNEETLTYLNQGQSYEIKLKKLGDLSAYRGKILKSSIRICFHERRLQYTEREQMLAWQRARPGERLLEVDVPLSYGMVDVSQASPSKNSLEFMWDPTKEVGVYIKVNCISTEFTPKKHGGEKGVPFRILVETRLPGGSRLHAASCQVKVFKLKGADRKHKQDRDKIMRRPPHEQDKYQPSYDCTVLSDIPLDSLSPPSPISQSEGNPFTPSESVRSQSRGAVGPVGSPTASTPVPLTIAASPIGQFINALEPVKEEAGGNTSSTVDTTVNIGATSTARSSLESLSSSAVTGSLVPEQASSCETSEIDAVVTYELPVDASVPQTNAWLRARRFHSFQATFASFSAGDILRLSRDDLIQICGLADGIRLFNALHSKAPTPKLTLYFAMEGSGATPWRVIYLENLNSTLLASKLLATLNLSHDRLHSVLIQGPQGVHVLVSNELVANIKDESMYLVEIIKDCASERYKLLLKPSSPR